MKKYIVIFYSFVFILLISSCNGVSFNKYTNQVDGVHFYRTFQGIYQDSILSKYNNEDFYYICEETEYIQAYTSNGDLVKKTNVTSTELSHDIDNLILKEKELTSCKENNNKLTSDIIEMLYYYNSSENRYYSFKKDNKPEISSELLFQTIIYKVKENFSTMVIPLFSQYGFDEYYVDFKTFTIIDNGEDSSCKAQIIFEDDSIKFVSVIKNIYSKKEFKETTCEFELRLENIKLETSF